jgi:hypothetical protein
LFFVSGALAQTKILFEHNQFGNRISRHVDNAKSIPSSDTVKNISVQYKINNPSTEQISVTVFPNPTKDLLKIIILNLPKSENAEIKIFSTKGNLLFEQLLTGDEYSVNMSEFSPGIYILNMAVGDKQIVKQIIKQ